MEMISYRVLSWSEQWQLPFNKLKCMVLYIGSGNPLQTYAMRDKDLVASSVEMDLGVRVDRDLKFREQAAAAVAKAGKVMGVINPRLTEGGVNTPPLPTFLDRSKTVADIDTKLSVPSSAFI